jgi:hypothetical protein
MTCLDIKDKIALMIDQMLTSKKMLADDSIRPDLKQRLEEELAILKTDVRELYIDLFKVQDLDTISKN